MAEDYGKYRSLSEKDYAEVIKSIGLFPDYERPWGTHKPEFTICNDKALSEVIAVAEVKDYDYTKRERAELMSGKPVGRSFDPHDKIRKKIEAARKQFKECKDYPCLLILGSKGPPPPIPIFVMAAMLGDYKITFPVPGLGTPDQEVEPKNIFSGRGKMVDDKGRVTNSTITAVGILEYIKPDSIISGYDEQLKRILDKYYDNESEDWVDDYVKACEPITKRLTKQGFRLEQLAPHIQYVLNPLSNKPFPKSRFVKGLVSIWEYDIEAQRFDKTYDWQKQNLSSSYFGD